MKTLRTLLAAIVALVAMVASGLQASAQAPATPDMLRLVVSEIQKQLPLEAETGIALTAVSLNDDATLMTWTIKVDPKKMGTTLEELKSELGEYSDSDFGALLGDEMENMIKMLGCKCDVVVAYPDKTTKVFHLSN